MHIEQMTIAARGEIGSLGRDLRALARLRAEFPSAPLQVGDVFPREDTVAIEVGAWRDPAFDPIDLDARVGALDREGVLRLVVRSGGRPLSTAIAVAAEVLTRCQRFLDRRNSQSCDARFEALLAAHRAMHDLARPLERAHHEHALDVWQWALRLDPRASFELQAAALLHRAGGGADGCDALEDECGSAARAEEMLARLGVEAEARRRIGALVAADRRRAGAGPAAVLAGADALSFFSLESSGFVRRHGRDRARSKVRRALARLGPAARARLGGVRLARDVAALVAEAE